MTNLTMGQRIAAQRKLKALSQEALAEQLEVSRQAVSKWESDAAIPEVDKLIALGKLFGVSVGWLLGTETECRYDPDAGLNENQVRMVEQIVAQSRPPEQPRWKKALAAVCALALLGGTAIHYQGRIDALAAANTVAQTQLAELTRANQQIQTQLDEMNEMLQKQDSASKLLSDYGITGTYLSEDLKNVTMTFALTPKVYQESLEACLVITSPFGESKAVCRWDGVEYLVRITVALEDDYVFSFRLEGEDSWREERLNDWDPSLGLLKTLSAFSIDQSEPQYEVMAKGEAIICSPDETTYTFNARLYPPRVLPQSATSYQDIVFTLYHNDEAIWTESWKEEFLNAYGAHRIYALPVAPDISVELPQLASGDTLRLEITATLAGGQVLTTVLDRWVVS